MFQLKILFAFILFYSAAFALDFSLITNVDAEVTFKSGSSSQSENTVGGEEKSVSISWINSQMNVDISVKSKSDRYSDTAFTLQMGFNASTYSAWESGKQYNSGDKVSYNGQDWQCGWWSQGDTPGGTSPSPWTLIGGEETPPIEINLPAKPLSADSAYIPIRSNIDVTLEISSEIYNETRELKAKTLDTLILPLKGSTAINGKSASKKAANNKIISRFGHHLITLNKNDYKNGDIKIYGINGRIISQDKISGINQTSLTLGNLATGMYVLRITGINGTNFTSKIMHNGGDFRLGLSFNGDFEIGGIVNSKTIRTAELRAGSVNYKIIVRPKIQGLRDTTINIIPESGFDKGGLEEMENIYIENPNASPSEKFEDLLSKEQYEKMFPNRYGFGRQDCANATANADPNCSKRKAPTGNDGDYDYYSYESFLKAIDLMGEIEVDYEFGQYSGLFKMTWKNKRTNDVKIITHPKFEEYGGASETVHIDYADYCNSGDLNTRKQELAASLAHMTQETGGYGTSGDVHFHWGLYWREEAGNPGPYASADPLGYYNPVPGKSYHGRGPKQLTHPYNYGPFSEFLYGDKDILLNNPDLLCPPKPEDATVAFASAIWFWMTPQPPKPSSHDVMTDKVDAKYIIKDRAKSKFGWTISIINGGYECGSAGDIRADNRIQHYKRYMQVLGTSDETADYGCYDMN